MKADICQDKAHGTNRDSSFTFTQVTCTVKLGSKTIRIPYSCLRPFLRRIATKVKKSHLFSFNIFTVILITSYLKWGWV